ncbi:MAG: disulfide bond formation protein [Caulobacter sp.]|nr:disulfide bond formation protein [Caulobacter sp.]
MTALDPVLKRWPLLAFLAAAAMLAVAHAFETFGHLAPCHLCLQQREVYWVAMPLALAVMAQERFAPGLRGPSARWLLAAVFLVSAGLAFFHAGVEWKWWPGPTTCTGGGAKVTAADLAAMLNGTRAVTAPMCDKAAWVFLGLSMAGWNALASVILTALSVLSVRKAPKPA